MSLKNIGELGNSVKILNELGNVGEGKSAFEFIKNSLEGLDIDQASKKLMDLKLNPSLSVDALEFAKADDLLVGSIDEIDDGIKKVRVSAKSSFSEIDNVKTGLKSKLTDIALSPATWIAAASAIALVVQNLEQAHNESKSYASMNDKASSSYDQYNNTLSDLKSLQSEYDTTKEKIEELQSVASANGGNLSLTDQAELDKLTSQNTELERQISAKENIAKLDAQKAASEAASAVSENNYFKDTDRSQVSSVYTDEKGKKRRTVNAPGKEAGDFIGSNVSTSTGTVIDEVNDQIKQYGELKKAQDELYDSQKKAKTEKESNKIQEQIDSYSSSMKDLATTINTTTQSLNDNKDAMSLDNDNGQYDKDISAITNIANAWATAVGSMKVKISATDEATPESVLLKLPSSITVIKKDYGILP